MLFSNRKRLPRKKRARESGRVVFIKQSLIGVLILIFFGLLSIGIYYASRTESATISSIEIIGGTTVPHQQIRVAIEALLEGDYFQLVPRRFAWTYPQDEITDVVFLNNRIKNVQVEVVERTKLIVIFEEYRPIALWCEEKTSSECLFVDETGYAFAKAPYLEGASFLRFSDAARTPIVGANAFDGDYLERTQSFVNGLYTSLQLNIIHVERTSENDVTYFVSGGGIIKVSLRMSTEDTLQNLETILLSEEFKHIKPGNFKYIDLRFGNKIFVNEEVDSIDEKPPNLLEDAVVE